MYKTTTISQLRSDLASLISNLEDGPLLVLSHSKPAAMLVDPDMFESILERLETLEDMIGGRQLMDQIQADPDLVLNAEDVFRRLE